MRVFVKKGQGGRDFYEPVGPSGMEGGRRDHVEEDTAHCNYGKAI